MQDELNPQRDQMADESMVRNLAAQAECIWPQEEPLVRRYGLRPDARILDAGCGTGEITGRLAEAFPRARVLGVDVLDGSLQRARERWAAFGDRVRFENRSIFGLGLPDASFDLVTCRHVLQSIPHADRVIAELKRVLVPGGRLHLLAEDYGMIRFPARELDSDDLWQRGPLAFGKATGTDLRIGRNAYRLMREAGFRDVTVDHVVVDTLRCPRESFATIFEAWRDGYAEAVGEVGEMSAAEFRAHFDDMIATIRDPDGYGVWFVPIVSGVAPAG